MTATGLQKFLDVSLDASRVVLTDIFIHSENPSIGVIESQELLEPSVETVVKVAEDTLRGEHQNSIISFRCSLSPIGLHPLYYNLLKKLKP